MFKENNMSMYIVIQSTVNPVKITRLAEILQANKIYYDEDWMMNNAYCNPQSIKGMAIARLSTHEIVGAALIRIRKNFVRAPNNLTTFIEEPVNEMNCYVIPSMRRQGIGTILTKKVLKRVKEPIMYYDGIHGSLNFYQSINSKYLQPG